MRRASVAAVAVLAVVLFVGCAGRIDSVTSVTQVSATVNATLSCSRGESGQYWAEYHRSAGGAWTQVGRRSYNCSNSATEQRAYQLTGLAPGAAYQVRLCYDPAPVDGGQLCGDRYGTVNGTNYATFTTNSTAASGTCNRNATPATFASEVSAATAGQTVCLASGSYGTWQGTNKQITIRAASGATATMRYSFGSGDSGFTLDGMSGMGGTISSGASNITVKNSAFNTCAQFNGSQSNVVFDNNTHLNINATCGNSRLGLNASGVTIKNSLMQGGDADGAFISANNVLVENNRFINVCDGPTGNHADGLQFADPNGWPTPGDSGNNYGYNAVVRHNFFQFNGCNNGYAQALTSYDSGTEGALIEDNVIDTTRPWGIELYSDDGSIVRHNTVRYYPDSQCVFSGLQCGQIDLTRKSVLADAAGSGTQVYDNIGIVNFAYGSTAARNDHNINPALVTFVGPLTSYAGFRLAAGSVGKAGASDGTDVGMR
jgi:hypothetical protein